jgi:hypothetical protein
MPIKSFCPFKGIRTLGGGLIWWASDDRNYSLVRANPLEQKIRVYRVVTCSDTSYQLLTKQLT